MKIKGSEAEEAEGRITRGVSGLGLGTRAVNQPSRSFTMPGEGPSPC